MASDDATPADDRPGRVAFVGRALAANWRALAVDAVVIAAWVGLLAVTFWLVDVPLLAFYVALVGGIVAYTLTRAPLVVPGE